MRAIIILFGFILSSCATAKFDILEVNSLAASSPGDASFNGLESIADRSEDPDARRVNIMFLHGIGWVENGQLEDALADNFLNAVANSYGLEMEEGALNSRCGLLGDGEDGSGETRNHIYIKTPSPKNYRTSIPSRALELDRVVCMDRQVLPVRDDLKYVVYRIFWDEAMWDSLQFAHVGQDDSIGDSSAFANLRKGVNRNLKDQFVNFGFSDAVMYLGPAGQDIRNAITGAMCAAALDAAGRPFREFDRETDYQSICDIANEALAETDPFAFVSESLGSKIALDVVRGAMTDGQETVHDAMIRRTEMYMLANQIPLLSLSDLSDDEPFKPSDYGAEDRPTLVAFSEINDFLTYEIVPFYEQLYLNSKLDPTVENDTDMSAFDRRELVNLLGFNAIDYRVEFAGPLIPFVGSFADPEFAHSGHVEQPQIMDMLLCGADGKTARSVGCDVDRGPAP